MHLTLDIPFSENTTTLLTDQALAKLLGLSDFSYQETPLEDAIASSFGLTAMPDFPLAAISAAADGIEVGSRFWLRADPVHLAMQRDAFSLSEPVPLKLSTEEASALVATLNQHFLQDGLSFIVGQSGQWYAHTAQVQLIETVLPAVAVNQNVHDVMPKGQDAAKWRGIFNQLQMLLHDHPVNLLREQGKKLTINSLWFSGCGVLPPVQIAVKSMSQSTQHMIGNSILYAGLAKYASLLHQHDTNLLLSNTVFENDSCKNKQVRVYLPDATPEHFVALYQSLKKRRLQTLTIQIGFYAHTLVLVLRPSSVFRCWRNAFWQGLLNRKIRPLFSYLERLNSRL
jgi:hypothetical protein